MIGKTGQSGASAVDQSILGQPPRRDRAAARSEQLRRRAKAHRFWLNPWAEMRRDAWQFHNDALAHAFKNRAAWDHAIFDNQYNWFKSLADKQFAWLDYQADWQRAIADRRMEDIERVMDMQADWMLAHQPVPLYGAYYPW